MLRDCWVAHPCYASSPAQPPKELVNPLPSDREEQISFVRKLFSPLQVLPHHVQGALVNGNHPSPFNRFAISFSLLLDFNQDSSALEVYVLNPYADKF